MAYARRLGLGKTETRLLLSPLDGLVHKDGWKRGGSLMNLQEEAGQDLLGPGGSRELKPVGFGFHKFGG